MERTKLHKSNDLVSGIFRCSPSEMPKEILVLNIFLKFKENASCKVCYHLKGSWAPVNGYVDDDSPDGARARTK